MGKEGDLLWEALGNSPLIILYNGETTICGQALSSSRQKGLRYAVDDMCHSLNFVAAGIYYRLHDGWSHSHPAGHRHHCVAGPSYSGTKTFVALSILAGEGEGSGKGVVRESRTILPNLTGPSAEKVLESAI
jgi:hypothetical protein